MASRLRLLSELLGDLEGVGEIAMSDLTGDRMLRHAVERILTHAVAVRELAEVSRRADNAGLLGALPDLGLATDEIAGALEQERGGR